MKTNGIISHLVKARGFGFIRCEDGHEVFFHRSQIQGSAFELLTPGQTTVFNVALDAKGLQAINVRLTTEIPTRKIKNQPASGKEATPLLSPLSPPPPAQPGKSLAERRPTPPATALKNREMATPVRTSA